MHSPVPRELNRANLILVTKLLSELDVIPFFGTLLGLVREGDIIANDDDIDFLLKQENAQTAIGILKSNGYALTIHESSFMQFSLEKDGIMTFVDFYLFDAGLVRGALVDKWNFFGRPDQPLSHMYIPSNLVFPLKPFVAFGHTFLIPSRSEECCKFLYGARWKVPASKFGGQYRMTMCNHRPVIAYEGDKSFEFVKGLNLPFRQSWWFKWLPSRLVMQLRRYFSF